MRNSREKRSLFSLKTRSFFALHTLAIVSSVTTMIMIAAACPPGDSTPPDDDKVEKASGETDGQDQQVSEETTGGQPE